MTSRSSTWTRKVRCLAANGVVDANELVRLTALAEYVGPDEDRLRCELVAGHDGSHIALVATRYDGEQWWWLRWDGQPGEVIQIDPCDAELSEGRYADDCFLPANHPGAHSFDLQPLTSSPGRRHAVPPRPHRPRNEGGTDGA
jgi:hypothetical protein